MSHPIRPIRPFGKSRLMGLLALALSLGATNVLGEPVKPPTDPRPNRKPDPVKLTKNQAKARRRAARARKGGH